MFMHSQKIRFATMEILWPDTAIALQDFANILVCGKCGLKPVSPIRFTSCGHFFCCNCVKSITKCFICNIPVQPKEMSPDHTVSNLIRNCDIIAEIINKRDLWDTNNIDSANISMGTTVCKTICTPKNTYIPKRNINKTNFKGETQLHTACLKRNIERVTTLLALGANPNTKDNAGWTPLQEIVSYGHTQLCELLLKGGASPNIPGTESRRPLHDAVISGGIEEAKLLLRYHADKDVYDKYGKSPLDYCKSDEMREILMGSHESPYPSKRTPDFNQTMDKSFIMGQDKMMVLASNLRFRSRKALNLVAAQHKFKVLTAYRSTVTHVIVETKLYSDIAESSVDAWFAIVRGCWLLNSKWITLAADVEDVFNMDFEAFEVSGAPVLGVPKKARLNAELQQPRLFNNCFFYFALSASRNYWRIGDIYLNKDDLTKLVKEGEGTVLAREPHPEDLKDGTRAIPFHTANDASHPLHECTHYIIYMPGKSEPRVKYNMQHIKTLPLMWLIECIENFTLIDPAYLGLP
ncbi:PREDICTED: BRCA1-associated RING domain protein 1-like isoform X2 [Dinoponera quadriceps]|uniref:BRCA1-associated RING domain protein 1-like isoform X2 n=1 Tax=Dinoponera quadriceps TaxID=609295 RepID=A0A6P3WYV0_DINQU|nr:PREDICTED: BRCA1-associated RING domain protein 1-like isoform X2 [Dinoponera quadriceps]